VRSFSKLYNPKLAVLIFKELKNMGYKTSLSMVGPDNDGSLFATKALVESLGLEVTFTGKLEKKEWVKLSKDYNYFINTTNFDNLPVSIIEAFALGFPTISTNVGGLPFLIQSNVNGILVKPNDVEAFVNAILRLHKNENIRTRLIQEAITSSKLYEWDNVKAKWLALLC
jgi:colanic acid/amylovoran biosynthesis glycosyltransferase